MKNLISSKEFNEKKKSEIPSHSNKVGDMNIVMKQLNDYVKPGDNKSGYDADMKKEGNSIFVYKDDNYVKISDNGLPNDFYTIEIKDSKGKRSEGNENAAENVLAFVSAVFTKSNGIDKVSDKLK